MSVILFGQEEWQKLFNTLYFNHNSNSISRIRIFSEEDIEKTKKMFKLLKEKHSDEDILQHLLANFIMKVALANQLTFGYAYHLDRGEAFEMKPFEDFKDPSIQKIYTHKELFKEIGSIIYNCVSNGGTNFLTQELLEKLKEIQISCAYKLAED